MCPRTAEISAIGTPDLSIEEAALCLVIRLPEILPSLDIPANACIFKTTTLIEEPSPLMRVYGASSLTNRYSELHSGLSFSMYSTIALP